MPLHRLGFTFMFAFALSLRVAVAEGPPVHLLSISVGSSGGSAHVIFAFDSDIRTNYPLSRFTLNTTTSGVSTSSPPQLVNFDPGSPKTVPVALDFSALSAAETVQVSVTLVDAAQAPVLTTPFYSLDLSFLKVIKGYQSQILSLQQDKQALEAQFDQAKKDRQDVINGLSPTTLDNLGNDLVGDTTVILHLSTDIYSKLQVQNTETGKTITDVGQDHHLAFTGLAQSTPYHFKAVPLDATGQPILGLTRTIPVTTKATVAFAPTFRATTTDSTTLNVTVNLDPSGALPAGFKGYIALKYREVVDAGQGIYGQPTPVGNGSLNSFGVPQGTAYTGSSSFTIPVSPNKTYEVFLTAYDEYGLTYTAPNAASATTPGPTPALDFAGPVQITMNTNTGLTVNWKANRKVQTAGLEIAFSDGKFVLPAPVQASTANADITVNTDLAGLTALLAKSKDKQEQPTLTVSMSDGKESKSQSFTVAFVIAGNSNSTDPTVKRAVNKVSTAAHGNGNIKWADVVNTGLGILLKVLR